MKHSSLRRGTKEMARTEFRRTEPMKKRNPIGKVRKGTSIRSRNPKRAKKRKEEGLVYGPYHWWIATLPCALRGVRKHVCKSEVAGHHITTVGAGGQDRGNEIPLCACLHTDTDASVHMMGPDSFEAYWMIDMRRVAIALELDYEEGSV